MNASGMEARREDGGTRNEVETGDGRLEMGRRRRRRRRRRQTYLSVLKAPSPSSESTGVQNTERTTCPWRARRVRDVVCDCTLEPDSVISRRKQQPAVVLDVLGQGSRTVDPLLCPCVRSGQVPVSGMLSSSSRVPKTTILDMIRFGTPCYLCSLVLTLSPRRLGLSSSLLHGLLAPFLTPLCHASLSLSLCSSSNCPRSRSCLLSTSLPNCH